jgi:hypothetical protein
LGEYINFFYPLVTHTLQSPSLNGSDIELHEGGEMRKVSLLIGLALFTLAGSARAQDEAPAAAPAGDTAAAPAGDTAAAPAPAPEAAAAPAPAPAAAAGNSYVSRGLTVGAGTFQATVPVLLNLSKDKVLKPVMVPLDLRYGVTDQLDVFVNHSTPGGSYAAVGPTSPSGVCIGGKDRGCDKFYNNLNIGAQFSAVKDAAMELAAFGALQFRALDPMTLGIDVGVNFKYNAGPLAVKVAPQISIGANKRSDADGANKEIISVPVQIAFQATPELAAFVDTGITGPLSKFSDNYYVPVGIGASFAAMPNLDVGGEFMLPMVHTAWAGDKAFDARVLMVFASYRTK